MNHANTTNLRCNLLENSQPFSSNRGLEIMETGYVATRMGEAADVTTTHRSGYPCEHNRNRAGFAKKRRQRRIGRYEEQIRFATNQFGSLETSAFGTFSRKPIFELDVLAVRPSEIAQAFPKNSKISLPNFV